jgi:hypothetical protein
MKAQIGGLASRMDVDKAESKAERKADKAEMKASQEKLMEEMKPTIRSDREEMIKAITGASREATEACGEKTKALPGTMEACPVKMEACLEKESASEATEVVEESREVPEGATDEKAFGATEDRAGEHRLAVRHHRQQKKRPQVSDGPWQKFSAVRGQFTRCAIPAVRKGHACKGLGRNRCSGVRGPGRTSGSRMEDRSLKKWRTKVNAVGGTPKGRTSKKRRRTRPKCNNGIRGRGTGQHRHVE